MGVLHVLKWPKVALKGQSQVIPSVCPNCCRQAEVELRYCYIHPLALIRPTRYFQSFRYCTACGDAALAHLRHLRRTDWMTKFPGLLLIFLGAVAAGAAITEKLLPGSKDAVQRGPIFAAAAVAGGLAVAALLWLLTCWSKSAAVKKHPKRLDQAVWGVAAFYTGSSLLDLLDSAKVYRAPRPEWLAALVKSNPGQVDDATYRQVVGENKPAVQAAKPFAA